MGWFSRLISFKSTQPFTPPSAPTDEQIQEAEAKLHIRFPQSFKTFLRQDNELDLSVAATFYWIGVDSHLDIVKVNRPESKLRTGISPFTGKETTFVMWDLPEYLVAFFTDGMGNQVCFDTRQADEHGEYSIVFWDHELPSEENLRAADHHANNRQSRGIVAASFDQWLTAELACHQ